MKKFLVLLLLGLSLCWFFEVEQPKQGEVPKTEEQEEETPIPSFNVISVIPENVNRVAKFQNKETLYNYIKEQAKDLEEKKKTWNKNHGKTFLKMAKLSLKSDSNTAVMPGLLSEKHEDFLQKKAAISYLSKEVNEEFNGVLAKIKKEGKEGDIHTYIKVYRDDDVDKIFRSVIVVDIIRDDDRHDLMFITSTRQFDIPPVKRLKESAKEKEEKDLTEADYEYYTPEDFSEEQLNAILEWYDIANIVALLSYVPK